MLTCAYARASYRDFDFFAVTSVTRVPKGRAKSQNKVLERASFDDVWDEMGSLEDFDF